MEDSWDGLHVLPRTNGVRSRSMDTTRRTLVRLSLIDGGDPYHDDPRGNDHGQVRLDVVDLDVGVVDENDLTVRDALACVRLTPSMCVGKTVRVELEGPVLAFKRVVGRNDDAVLAKQISHFPGDSALAASRRALEENDLQSARVHNLDDPLRVGQRGFHGGKDGVEGRHVLAFVLASFGWYHFRWRVASRTIVQKIIFGNPPPSINEHRGSVQSIRLLHEITVQFVNSTIKVRSMRQYDWEVAVEIPCIALEHSTLEERQSTTKSPSYLL